MAMSLRKRLKKAEKLLAEKEKEYKIILAAYKKTDDGIDDEEAFELNGLLDTIKMNREVISDAYFDKLREIKEFDALEAPEVTVPADSYKYGEAKLFTDPDYLDIFHSAIYDWAQDIKIALNSVTTAASKSSSSAHFEMNSLLGVIVACFGGLSVHVSVAIAIGNIIASEVEKGIRSSNSEPVDPDELNKTWQDTFGKYANKSKAEEFAIFIESWKASDFKEDMRVPGDTKGEYIGTEIFNKACRSFPQNALPSDDFFKKRFLQVLLSKVQNDDIWEDKDEAGDAELHFAIENYDMRDDSFLSNLSSLKDELLNEDKPKKPFIPEFKFFHGQLDDVSVGLLHAIKTVYTKTEKIINLPVKINISVFAADKTTRLFFVKRESEKVGDNNFQPASGGMDNTFQQDFIKSNIMDTIKIGQLSYDD